MAEARGRDNWQHTSVIVATLVNSNPFRKGKPATPSEFDPYAVKAKAKAKPLMVGIDVLQMLFCPRPPSTATAAPATP